MSSTEVTTNLDTVDFSGKKKRISSPTSLEACRLIGVDPEELFALTQEEYILYHPECKTLEKSLKEERYKHFEEVRQANIEAARQKPTELKNAEKENLVKARVNIQQ